jgi:dihydroflavonol-4-reductase
LAKTVVTGASGHLGANLVRELLTSGRTVAALVREDRRGLVGLDVEVRSGDVRDAGSLRRAFRDAEVVYHCAGYVSIAADDWPRLRAVNVEGTRNVVDACRASGVRRLVHFSSIEALVDTPHDLPVDESRPLVGQHAASLYACSKAAGEAIVRQAAAQGQDVVILNPTAIIGPHDYRRSYSNAGLLAMCGGRLPALVEGSFNWVDVRDAAAGAIRAEEQAPAGRRYILGGHGASVQELAMLAHEINGVRVPRLVCPMWLARLAAPLVAAWCAVTGRRALLTSAGLRPLRGNRHISHALAERELGYRPRPLRDTVADTLRWFKEHDPT